MRRKEFEVTDKKEITDFLNAQQTGVLSYCDDNGIPFGLPISYVVSDDMIYLHCGPQGEKMTSLTDKRKVMLTVFKEYSYIPPYFTGRSAACGASQFYKSVMISGHLEIISDVKKKIAALENLMKKFQPEGGYDKMNGSDMEKMIAATVIIAIVPDKITAKFKFGQNISSELIDMITDNLVKRNSPLDIETVEMIKKFSKKKG